MLYEDLESTNLTVQRFYVRHLLRRSTYKYRTPRGHCAAKSWKFGEQAERRGE